MKKLRQRYSYSLILLRQLVKTDFKLRYQGSILGYVWSLLRPLGIFLILFIVFDRFLKVGDTIPHYPVYLLLGIVLWNYFVEVTTGSVSSIVGNGDLIRKINFPKYVIVLAGSFSALINLLLNFIIITGFMIISDVDIPGPVAYFPLIIFELFVFSLAVAFLLSAAFVRYRDVGYIWDVLIQGAFYATPILYPLSLVPLQAAKLIMLNPMAQIIQDARYVLVTHETQTGATVYDNGFFRYVPILIVIVTIIIAATYFRHRSRYFAEEV